MMRTRLLVLGLLVAASVNRSDTLTGEARGEVRDVESRNAIRGATMSLLNVDRGWRKQGTTDAAGNYVFVQLEPGNYTVIAEMDGYYRSERTDILIRLNQPKVVVPPFELRRLVTTPTQQITVQGEQTKIAIVDLTSPGPNPAILAMINEPGVTSMVSLQDWTLRSNFDAAVATALPLRGGRSFDQLSLLAPGVFRVPFSGGQGPAVGNGVGSVGQFSVNGLRSRSNNFTVDGSDNNDEDIGVRRQGFVALVPQGIESVREFQVMTAGFAPEFGRNSGSMVNAVSRSGQRRTSGSVYGLLSDSAWNAGSPFERPFIDSTNMGRLSGGRYDGPDFRESQFGGVLGGAVSSKVFYFGSADGQRHAGDAIRHFVVPRAAERGLRTRFGVVGMNELASFLDDRNIPYGDAAGKGVFELYPLPNDPLGPFGLSNYAQARRVESDGFVGSMKIDWYVTPANSLATRYNFTDDRAILPFTDGISSTLRSETRTQNLSLFLNSTRTSFANALRVSFGRTRLRFPPDRGSELLFGSAPVPSLGVFNRTVDTRFGRFGPFGATGPVGQVWIQPFSRVGVDVFNFPQGRVNNTFQWSDFVTIIRGRHTFKAGTDIRRTQLNSFADRNSRPLLIFGAGIVSSGCMVNPSCPFATDDGALRGTDLAALGAPAGFLQTISTERAADSTIGLRLSQFDFFVQDDWKIHSRFTLNLGLRYERQTVPVEVNRRIERTFDLAPSSFGRLTPQGQSASTITAGNAAFDAAFNSLRAFTGGRPKIYDPDSNNVAPRVGFAWDPTGSGRMALRAGYSIGFDANLGAVTSQSRNVFPTFLPLNLDLNFSPPTGRFVNSPGFFSFTPTSTALVQQNSLNVYNLSGDSFATGLGVLLRQAPPLPGTNLSSNGIAFTLPERDFESGYAQHAVVSVERQVGVDYLVTGSLVGTRGLHLSRFTTPNAGLVSTPVLFSTSALPLTILDIPPSGGTVSGSRPVGLGAFTVFQNSARSSYGSLQLGLEKRMSRGLQFSANWTWSHVLDDVSDPFDARGFHALPQDNTRLDLEHASANFDVRHRAAGMFVWNVPAIRNAAWARGWTLSGFIEMQTGQPFTVNSSVDRNLDGNLTDRPDSLRGITVTPGSAVPLRLDPAVSSLTLLAAQGANGRTSRNSFRADGISTTDVALSRTFGIRGGARLEARLEAFNLWNQASYGVPVRVLESPAFGRAFDLQVNPRAFRAAFRLTF